MLLITGFKSSVHFQSHIFKGRRFGDLIAELCHINFTFLTKLWLLWEEATSDIFLVFLFFSSAWNSATLCQEITNNDILQIL